MRSLSHVFSLTLAALLTFGSAALAQCPPAPDGLDNGIPCVPALLNVPQVSASTDALGICWQDCQPAALGFYNASWGLPSPFKKAPWSGPACGWFTSRFSLFTGNQTHWSGTLRLIYARSWEEANPVHVYQVWRFLVNGDLKPSTSQPCGVPPCAAAFNNKVHFTGYIDYAYNCVSGQWEYAWMLTHGCDAISHKAPYVRAGNFHPDFSYTFVGPGTGFNIGAAPTVENGAGTLESVRSFDVTSMPPRCRYDEPLQQFSVSTIASICPCGNAPVGGMLMHEASLQGTGQWGTSFYPIPTHRPFLSMAIGSWNNPLTYTGNTELRWNHSFLNYIDPCLSTVPRREHFFGVTTLTSNFPYHTNSNGSITPLPPMFIDQANSRRIPPSVEWPNAPHWSDHVLNLNL